MSAEKVAISLKRFLLIEGCPAAWKDLDLYLLRDEEVVFYIGQSHQAFARVWEHLLGGFKGHSIPGRFVWCNWPASMKFMIELMSSRAAEFESVGNDLTAAERQLIQRWSPCFNVSQNSQPTPVPSAYLPFNARLRRRQSLITLIHQAARAVQAEEDQLWVKELDEGAQP
jgi:hypothetical protein